MQRSPIRLSIGFKLRTVSKFKFTTSFKDVIQDSQNCKQESQAMTVKMLNAHASGNQGPR